MRRLGVSLDRSAFKGRRTVDSSGYLLKIIFRTNNKRSLYHPHIETMIVALVSNIGSCHWKMSFTIKIV